MPDAVANPWECEHETHELRLRRIANGGIQYRRQCLRCGSSVGHAVAHALVTTLPPEWDDALLARWEAARSAYWRAHREARESAALSEHAEWLAQYEAYLLTSGWQMRRRRVLERERYICQGCREERAVEVHHTTYRTYNRAGRELLCELVALCPGCHDLAHGREGGHDA